ncbi:hypothetical protein [Rhodopirellula europaea]|uniref:hypothetical protein n=1 Tax=Rhodopirellula europaea TaxID=1263866 RepID=UPI003D2A1C7D
MTQFRRLCFECMEPRIPLATHAFGSPSEINASDLARLLETNDAESILRSLVQQTDPSAGMQDTASPITPIAQSQYHGSEVRLSVLLADEDRQPVDQFNPDQVYLASVFVEETRVDTLRAGGVFQAFVDVQFSENIVPAGDVTFGPAFNAEMGKGSIESTRLIGVGSMVNVFKPTQQASHLLFEIPFVISGSDSPTFIRVTPSASTLEPILLFNRDEAIPKDAVFPASVNLPVSNSTILTAQEVSLTPIAVPPSAAPPTSPPNFGSGLDLNYTRIVPSLNNANPYASKLVRSLSLDRNVSEAIADWQRRLRETDQQDDLFELQFPKEGLLDLADEPMLNLDAYADKSDDADENSESVLFFDERLFLEANFVSPWASQLRLHFRIFPTDSESGSTIEVKKKSRQHSRPADGLVDIAVILRPSQLVVPEAKQSDQAIVELTSPPAEKSQVNPAQPIFFDIPFNGSYPETTPVEQLADVAWSIDHHPRLDLNRQGIGDP